MLIVGIDPGVNNIGIAFYDTERDEVLHTVLINWEGSYMRMCREIKSAIGSPDEISIEKPYFTPMTLPNNIRTLEIIGLIKMVAEGIKVSVYEYAPSTIKKEFTGNGRAKKEDIIKEVRSRYSFETQTNHEADAIAIAYTHHAQRSRLHNNK